MLMLLRIKLKILSFPMLFSIVDLKLYSNQKMWFV